jgi:mannose-6-phosphate isomerase-like protein (cupin superfamily)
MADAIDRDLEVERHDVFDVMQLTRGTRLEAAVAADVVTMAQGQVSQVHRHNLAETVLYFLDGSAIVRVGDDELPVTAGDRLTIGKAVYHGVRTPDSSCRFLSVQSPPILNKTTGALDLEPLSDAPQ